MSLVPKSSTYIKVCFYFAFLAVFHVILTVNKLHTSKYFFKLLPYDIIDIWYCLINRSECLTTFVNCSEVVSLCIVFLNMSIWTSLFWCLKRVALRICGGDDEEDDDKDCCCWCCGPPGSGEAANGGEGGRMSREAKLMERKRARRAEARGIVVV